MTEKADLIKTKVRPVRDVTMYERWFLTKKTNLHELAAYLGGYRQAKEYLRGYGLGWENETGLIYQPERRQDAEGVPEGSRSGDVHGDTASGPQQEDAGVHQDAGAGRESDNRRIQNF